jgi:hypothetical protein
MKALALAGRSFSDDFCRASDAGAKRRLEVK